MAEADQEDLLVLVRRLEVGALFACTYLSSRLRTVLLPRACAPERRAEDTFARLPCTPALTDATVALLRAFARAN